MNNLIRILKGGRGSGNFNHPGRLGKQGGSGVGGGRIGAKVRDELLSISGNNAQRKKLATLAGHTISVLQKQGLLENVSEIRVMGSFAGSKENPNDIDLAFLVPDTKADAITSIWMKTEFYKSLPTLGKKPIIETWFTPKDGPMFDWFARGTKKRHNVDPISVWSNNKNVNISNE